MIQTVAQLKPLRALTTELNRIVRGPMRGHVTAWLNYERSTIVVKVANTIVTGKLFESCILS